MKHMRHVILGQEFERHGFILADSTRDFQFGKRKVSDDVREIPVVIRPERDQQGPIGFLGGLYARATVLVIAGKIQRVSERRPHEPLMVIRR